MIIVVLSEPDHQSRQMASAALRFAGYSVEPARSVGHLRSLLRGQASAAVVDPSGDIDAVADLRALTEIPIIVVSSSSEEWAKVAALDAGADDYLTKPYGVEELVARVRVALRRSARTQTTLESPISTADFTVDVADRRWRRSDGTEVRLTPTEWRLVEMLLRRPGRLVSQVELLAGV